MASSITAVSPTRRSPSPIVVPAYRQSLLSTHSSMLSSSATSYKTAPVSAAASRQSLPLSTTSTASSPHTITNRDGDDSTNNEQPQIIMVTSEVEVETGPAGQDSYFTRTTVTKSVTTETVQPSSDEVHFGPPPPSPPASVERDELEPPPPPSRLLPASHSDSVIRESSTTARERQASSTSSRLTARSSTFDTTLHRASTDTKGSLPTLRYASPPTAAGESSSKSAAYDPYLQPPVAIIPMRPTRRNTTGSSPIAASFKRGHQTHTRQYGSSSHSPEDASYIGEAGIELASDIEIAAEQIRRERMEKRAKQQLQQEAEAALTRAEARPKSEQDMPLVGNLIGEDHVNYVLMYNMLTGIRIGVSRCQAKIKRPLTIEDFTARHKFSFDIVGNELTPSAKYDFKFKDYAPWVFRTLREDIFHLDPADYLLSLTAKYILSELGSPGKSGSFFYFSRDYRFIIKTIRHSEHKFLLSILPQYFDHVKENPHTLLSRFYGLHRVKLPRGRKIHFVIMNNLFPPHKDIHETYDLKGSTVGREYPEDKAARNPRAVLKDLNWIKRGKALDLGPEKRALLTEQLRRDAEFLRGVNVMDYSLLVGIHNMQRGNRDNVRRNTLKVFSPDLPNSLGRSKTTSGGHKSPEAIAMRRAMRSSDPKRLGKHTIRLPEEDIGDRLQLIFYQDEAGLRATDEGNEGLDVIYYLGVIDILTPYSLVKRAEHLWKGLKADRTCVGFTSCAAVFLPPPRSPARLPRPFVHTASSHPSATAVPPVLLHSTQPSLQTKPNLTNQPHCWKSEVRKSPTTRKETPAITKKPFIHPYTVSTTHASHPDLTHSNSNHASISNTRVHNFNSLSLNLTISPPTLI
ncbi:phosphatidylinositol phosphate kinase PIPK5 [Laccaria bicolor S238N-H82]|uniref:1-phosphatidylinositol-4-phosphate 5-kinase n=1 Tax=Laccaria bicolor (strain S238N-H82 / ATCC MYA-4686) TaxID=486041 RepID=B0E2C5_LACBS|nr:phosphatidylinositol phosphate kinase PIPK5 [Laccaria bicolor S238N-H82]EDQ99005.1 phosphatidylinositol phosphate kinase PIPK5 [Laccaria bicolor S238N-H82]|eukprot:XP_001890342.1 phosphatidylinositol phosphate kinase PIPK5 [Laccaria bicolor S238N-H82]